MAAAGAAAAAAIAQAIKASGVLVTVKPEEFRRILALSEDPLVVFTSGGWFSPKYQYLTSYKGLAFFAGSPEEIALPAGTQVILARSIHIPG